MTTVKMTDLLPAIKRAEVVEIGGKKIQCRSLNTGELAMLFYRFGEEMKLVVENGKPAVEMSNTTICAIIAYGTGNGGDPEQEAAIAQFPGAIQTRLFGTIRRLTAPDGLGPFVLDLVENGEEMFEAAKILMPGLMKFSAQSLND